MNKYTVSFTARKGNSVFWSSVTVESEAERTAISIAETKAKKYESRLSGLGVEP